MLASTSLMAQQKFRCITGKVSFFSETPLEDIEAHSDKGAAILVAGANKIVVSIPLKSFQFPNSLMQDHFNEKYVESDKYPKATFVGKIKEPIDFSVKGAYTVTAVGKLSIHGIEKVRNISGVITVVKGKVHLSSKFTIRPEDHKIEIPSLVFEKIAEEITVNIEMDMNPY